MTILIYEFSRFFWNFLEFIWIFKEFLGDISLFKNRKQGVIFPRNRRLMWHGVGPPRM